MATFSTNHWDTVYAIRFPDVNKAIAKSNQGKPAVTFTQNDSSDDGPIAASGTFGDWQLTTGGSGRNIQMLAPLTSATFTFLGVTNNLTNLMVTLEVNLDWVTTGQTQNLVSGSTVGSVSVLSIDYGSNTLSAIRQSLFRNQLDTWLKNDVGGFQHTFAAVDLNDVADQQAFQWLKPTGQPSYAVADSGTGDDITKSVFAVLCMTGKRPSPETHVVSPDIIPDDRNSALLIAPERVVENMLLPGVFNLFGGARIENFELTNNGLGIRNNVPLTYGDVQLSDRTVRPTVGKYEFNLLLEDTDLKIDLQDMEFEWQSGINVSVNHTSWATLGINDNRQLQVLITGGRSNATVNSQALLIAEIVAPIGAAIAGGLAGLAIGAAVEGGSVAINGTVAAVEEVEMAAATAGTQDVVNVAPDALAQVAPTGIGGMTAKTWGAVIGVVAGAVLGAVPTTVIAVLKKLAEDSGQNMPTLDQFGTQALGTLTWPNTTPNGFTLKSLELAGALRLGIDVNFN